MAVRHRRLLDRLPRLRRPQPSRRLRRGSPCSGGVPKPASESVRHIVAGGSDSAIFAAPTFDDFWITCSTVSAPLAMRVVDRVGADRQRARRGLDHGVGADLPAIERRGDRERLHRRARLEDVGQRAVAHLLARDAVARIRVVRRPVGEREDLAALRVEDHEPAGLRAVAPPRPPSARGTRGTAAVCRSRARDRVRPAARGSTRRPRRPRRAG